MIVDLTEHGLDFKRHSLALVVPIELQPKSIDAFLFRRVPDVSYRDYMSPFHTGSQEERKEKQTLRDEQNYEFTDVPCPICHKSTKILPWRRLTGCCSECALDIDGLYDTKSYKETFNFIPRDRTQWILDIWNRCY